MPARVLVTGAAGFLGSRVARSYVAAGADVRGIVRLAAAADHLPPQVELVQLDLQALEVDQDIVAGHDLVVHTAAVVHATTSAERALQERVNVGATRDLIAACRKHSVPRMLHVSSSAAVGICGRPEALADETFPFNLQGLGLGYAETKREAESLVLAADQPGFETVVVNPGFMFGRHQHAYRGSEVVAGVSAGGSSPVSEVG